MSHADNARPVTLVLATRNRHKVAEIQAILGPGVLCKSLDSLSGVPALREDADTFAGNAGEKARQLAAWLTRHDSSASHLVLADDSGLEVDALDGAPGVRSARFAADETAPANNSPDQANNSKLLRLLQHTPPQERRARFRCVLALVETKPGLQPGTPRFFHGTCHGRIGHSPAGSSGFGYDPLFLPEGFESSFAQLGEVEKNQISHRRKALDALRTWLTSRYPYGQHPSPDTGPQTP